MDRFKQLQTFVAVAHRSSLSAVAAAEDVAPAFIIAENRRVVVAAPSYLRKHGTPAVPDNLLSHRCLGFGVGSQQRG